jgi:hypothetical protein
MDIEAPRPSAGGGSHGDRTRSPGIYTPMLQKLLKNCLAPRCRRSRNGRGRPYRRRTRAALQRRESRTSRRPGQAGPEGLAHDTATDSNFAKVDPPYSEIRGGIRLIGYAGSVDSPAGYHQGTQDEGGGADAAHLIRLVAAADAGRAADAHHDHKGHDQAEVVVADEGPYPEGQTGSHEATRT